MSNINKPVHTHTYTHTDSNLARLPAPDRRDGGQDIPIFTKLYEFYKTLSSIIPSFPKTKRYTLGQKLDNTTLDILEFLFAIPLSSNKLIILQKISVKVDLLKILIRLSKDTQIINNKDCLELETKLSEIGKMLGGWIRASKQNTT